MSRMREKSTFFLRRLPSDCARGSVTAGGRVLPCALGASGVSALKREGDRATPIGAWCLREVYFRADRVRRPLTGLPVRALRLDDGWCDAASDRNYNRRVPLPYPASAEHLWREDRIYDLIAVLGYNDRPRRRGRGSAIFMHIARSGFPPTDGCVAFAEADFRYLLAMADRETSVVVRG